MPNHHCLLHSLNPEYPDPPYNDALVNRFEDPGAGAFSYNMGREFTVYHDIQAGSELFLDYGVSECMYCPCSNLFFEYVSCFPCPLLVL